MQSHAREMTLERWRPLLDRRLAQGGMVIGAFATAAVLAALYGPGPRAVAGLPQTILPAAAAAAADTPRGDSVARANEEAARENARRAIAEALNRQAAASAASAPAAAAQIVAPEGQAEATAPPPPANFDEEDFEKLADRAAEAIRIGDIAGARLLLEHAIAAGDTTAIYALAETYDPRVLAKLHVRGMTGDADRARVLYQQALAKGVAQAQAKLTAAGQ
jgi:hypothetical protein